MNSKSQILYLAIAAIIGGVLGFLTSQTIQKDVVYVTEYISEESGEKVVREKDLPISSSIIQNPLIIDWRIGVSGVLVEKTDTTFTLEKENRQITISLLKGSQTQFSRFKEGVSEDVLLEDIPLGTSLRGTALLIPQDSGEISIGSPGDVVGERFVLQ